MKTKTPVSELGNVIDEYQTLVRDAAKSHGLVVKTRVRVGDANIEPQRDLGARCREEPRARGEDTRQGWGYEHDHNETLVRARLRPGPQGEDPRQGRWAQ